MRTLSLALGVALLWTAPAFAAPGDISVTFMAAKRYDWPWLSKPAPGEGAVHAFTCISLDIASGIKEECFGFYPAVPVNRVLFTNGDQVSLRSDGTWIEGTGPFTFTKQPSTNPSELMLLDPSRGFLWRIPRTGVSQWRRGSGAWTPYLTVRTYEVPSDPIGKVKGPGSVYSEFEEAPKRFANVDVSVTRRITPAQRAAVIAELSNWQSATYNLTRNSCIDLVDRLARIVGLKAPARSSTQLPVDYLTALKTLNP